jgi:hypothetical protein
MITDFMVKTLASIFTGDLQLAGAVSNDRRLIDALRYGMPGLAASRRLLWCPVSRPPSSGPQFRRPGHDGV